MRSRDASRRSKSSVHPNKSIATTGVRENQTDARGRSDFQGGAPRLKKNANPSQSAPGRIAGTRLEPHTKEASSSGRE